MDRLRKVHRQNQGYMNSETHLANLEEQLSAALS